MAEPEPADDRLAAAHVSVCGPIISLAGLLEQARTIDRSGDASRAE